MNQDEIRKCQAAAQLYRHQQKRIAVLEERIAILEERMNRIDREDQEVIAIVHCNFIKKAAPCVPDRKAAKENNHNHNSRKD